MQSCGTIVMYWWELACALPMVPQEDWLMQEQIQDFLNFLDTEKGYADNTIAAYRNDLTQFLRYLEQQGQYSTWAEVDKDTIINYVLNLKEREYTSSTVARKVAAIKSFFLIEV